MDRPFIRHTIYALVAASAVLFAGLAQAGDYPVKPITLVVPFAAGSGTDQLARGMAQVIAADLPGALLVVDNKPGASGLIAAQAVARAAPDGYTLFMTTNTTQSANPHLFKKLPYDPVKDFEPVAALAKGSMFLTVPGDSPYNSVADVIAAAKKRPLNYGAGNSSSRVAGEMFKQLTGAQLTYIPYKSNPQAVTDLVGNQLDLMFADTATALPLVKANKLKALGYTGQKRTSARPDVPTLDEAGVKGYELSYWVALYAPHGTPPDIVRKLNEAFVKAAKSDAVKSVYASSVLDVFTTTPEGLASFQADETAKWGRVIHSAGIEAE
jgi:tripartite-type tricarboxylate transporter receptor subunit TctC